MKGDSREHQARSPVAAVPWAAASGGGLAADCSLARNEPSSGMVLMVILVVSPSGPEAA